MSMNTRVIYNGACPVCSSEIGHYKAYSEQRALPIRFDDLNACSDLAGLGLTEDMAARRLHVLKDGVLLAGVPAFAALWSEMPRYRWLARLVMWPGVRHVAGFGYDRLVAPAIYAWDKRRRARAA